MKEIIRLLAKDNKEFGQFIFDHGKVYLVYYVKRQAKQVDIYGEDSDLNVRTINTIDRYLHELLSSQGRYIASILK